MRGLIRLGALTGILCFAVILHAAEVKEPMEVKTAFIEIEEAKIFYRHAGDSRNRPVLFLHGARFSSADWDRLGTLVKVAEAGFRAIAADLPGYGKSEQSNLEPVKFLERLLEALKLERPVLLAPSMSGQFALAYAAAHPEKLRGLVCVAPVGLSQYGTKLKDLKAPLLLIWGENDTVVPVEQAKQLKEAIPESELVIIPHAPHPSYLEKPEAFHSALLTFLDALENGSHSPEIAGSGE